MLTQMTWEQFSGWMRYYQEEPFGEERADLRSGIVASVIANVNRDDKKKPKPFKPSDFMPYSRDRVAKSAYDPVTDKRRSRGMSRALGAAFGPKRKRSG